MTSGKRNRQAGHSWEREIVDKFKIAGFSQVITSRLGSRFRDNQKIDLVNSDESKYGRLPYNVQAKNVKGHVKYAQLLSELPTDEGIINVVVHKQTAKVNERFLCVGKYAILDLEDFMGMVKKIRDYEQADAKRALVQSSKGGNGTAILPGVEREDKTGIQSV